MKSGNKFMSSLSLAGLANPGVNTTTGESCLVLAGSPPEDSDHRKLTCSSGLSSLAQPIREVFSFADAVGHLAYLFRARLDFAVARASAHEEVAGDATRRHDGTACALRFDHCLSMVCRRGGGMACLGARIHGLSAWFDDPWQNPDSCCFDCRRRDHCSPSVAEPAARGENSRRSAGLSSGHCGTDLAAIHRGVAPLSGARDYSGTLRGVPVSRFRHGLPRTSRVTSLGGGAPFFRSLRAGT